MNLSKNKYIIIQITGDINQYIAQILTEDPLVLKVTERGIYSRLKPWDYIPLAYPSSEFQVDPVKYLLSRKSLGKNVFTGLNVFRPLMEKRELFNVSYSKLDLLWYKIKLWFNK
jgi:hypothetical protein